MKTSKTTVASKTSPPKGTQPQNYVVTTEHSPGNQTGNEPVPFLNCSKHPRPDIQNLEQHVTTTITGDKTIPLLTTTTPLIKEGLLRDEQINEVSFPLTFTVILKRKQEMLYEALDFKNNLKVNALVDSRAYVTAIAQNDWDTKKNRKPPKIFSKSTMLPVFKYK